MIMFQVKGQTLYTEWPRDNWNARVGCGFDHGSPTAPQLPLSFAHLSFVPYSIATRP